MLQIRWNILKMITIQHINLSTCSISKCHFFLSIKQRFSDSLKHSIGSKIITYTINLVVRRCLKTKGSCSNSSIICFWLHQI
uniref:Uncharacterized protein n=1 Tax=Arundo donax TaxID=35708 RepID=A0A0A9CVU9_ARUDO